MSKPIDSPHSMHQPTHEENMRDASSSSTAIVPIIADIEQRRRVDGSTRFNRLEAKLQLREMTDLEAFENDPCGWTLSRISKNDQTPEMVRKAVEADGIALGAVSKKLITYDLCKIAVTQNGLALRYIPPKMITDELIRLAVQSNGLALCLIEGQITKELAFIAVRQTIELRSVDKYEYPIAYVPMHLIDAKLVADSISYTPYSLKNIPSKFITKDLILLAVSKDGSALRFVPKNRINKQLIEIAVNSDPTNLRFVPEERRTQEICNTAFDKNPSTLKWIPEPFITSDMCLKAIAAFDKNDSPDSFLIERILYAIRNDINVVKALIEKIGPEAILAWNRHRLERLESLGFENTLTKPLSDETVAYLQEIIQAKLNVPIKQPVFATTETPPPDNDTLLIPLDQHAAMSYNLMLNDDTPSKQVYYISDLHIELQLKDVLEKENCTFGDFSSALDKKIAEMISGIDDTSGYLLIAGDVGHSKWIVELFYQKLRHSWKGSIIAVLGNHELWDDHPEGMLFGYISRPINDIVSDYRKMINYYNHLRCVALLQNAIYIYYKNQTVRVIGEKTLSSVSEEEVRDICSKSSFIVLGGLGFSGLDERFNATNGLYRSAVTTREEDIMLSERFVAVYNKMLRCASDMQVIVLTHTPVSDWWSGELNPNWIYINGHTHHNSLCRKPNGTTILSDNQVGYKPIKWKLNSFTVSGWYDPFKDLTNGIYEISSDEYADFNRGRGIYSNGCKYPGKLFMLKKNGLYMFALQSQSSLCLLAGGQRKKLPIRDVRYYYDRMDLYAMKVMEAVAPFQKAISAIADEVKRIGGDGTIHGCIVDIDFYNHIYLNPADGTITPYFAWDIQRKYVYTDVITLLKKRSPELCQRYQSEKGKGLLPLLGQLDGHGKKKKVAVAKVPKLVLETDMYIASRTMKAIQYIFENKVIRIWNEDIFTTDFSDTTQALEVKRNTKKISEK